MATAMIMREAGGPQVLRPETVTVGEPGPGQVRLKQTAIGEETVRCVSESTLTLIDLGVTGSRPPDVTTSGDGIFASNCNLTLIRVNVSGNGGAGISATGGTVTLTDVNVSGNGDAGLVASAGADLTVRRSRFQENDDGGLQLENSLFVVENSLIGGRGSEANSGGPGVSIENPSAGSRFDYNTVLNNEAPTGASGAAGIDCNSSFEVRNSIVFGNSGASGMDVRNCDVSTSSVGVDPMLSDGLHLTAASTCCVDQGTDTDVPADDIDGDDRPCGEGTDIGADEFCP